MATVLYILWFILVAVLWIGYLALEGFDFGVGMLLRILPKNETERRQALTTIGPHWDGNEVWLLTAGGATFAAFPAWYGTMFAGMYLALFVILVCLIVRICALEWRSKINSPKWLSAWDWAHTISAWIPALLWGVAFANLLQGMNIVVYKQGTTELIAPDQVAAYSAEHPITHELLGGLLGLLSPYTILGGLVTLTLFLTHGAIYLALKTKGNLQRNAMAASKPLSLASLVVAAVFVIWTQFAYANTLLTWIPLLLAAVCLLAVAYFAFVEREGMAFACNFAGIAMAVVFIFGVLFPNALKSSVAPEYSLTLAQASGTAGTHVIMTVAAVIFVPIVLGYTIWSYWVFKKRVSSEDLGPVPGLDPNKIREFFAR